MADLSNLNMLDAYTRLRGGLVVKRGAWAQRRSCPNCGATMVKGVCSNPDCQFVVVCSGCHKVRVGKGFYVKADYPRKRVSDGICNTCIKNLYDPKIYARVVELRLSGVSQNLSGVSHVSDCGND